MKKLFTLLALTISFSMNAQMSDNSTNTSATGNGAVAMGYLTTASGNYSTAMGVQTKATAYSSTATGDHSSASGYASTATGFQTTASGAASTAMGVSTTASGMRSVAAGELSTASGLLSTVMGYYTTASDYASLVIGRYNSSGSSATSSDSFSTAAPAFVIGNGADSDNKSDAFKVMFNGDAYVSSSLYLAGTAITATAAEINLLDGVTTVGSGILSSVTENSNTGVRLSTSNASNHGDIGSNAVDLSYSDSSSSTKGATGDYSIAMGFNTTADQNYSVAMGESTSATGHTSFSIGRLTSASGMRSVAAGELSTASGLLSTAMGYSTTASGHTSIAMGRSTTASDYASLVIGQYNSSGSSVTNNATSFSTSNTAFVIGNGADSDNKSDAFKVMFNGDTTVSNDLTVSGDVVISSDARLKSNIVSLGSTLAKLLQIDGKSYTMKKDGKQKIGVLAQEIQEVFPELVTEDDNEMLAVNYQGLVPVLINALKEQESKFEKQQSEINELKEMLNQLISEK